MRRLWAIICRYWESEFSPPLPPQWEMPEGVENIADTVERGTQAEGLLRNRVLLSAMKELEQAIIQQWRDSGVESVEQREYLWLKLRTVDDLPRVLHGYVGAARMEKDRLRLEEIAKKQGKYK